MMKQHFILNNSWNERGIILIIIYHIVLLKKNIPIYINNSYYRVLVKKIFPNHKFVNKHNAKIFNININDKNNKGLCLRYVNDQTNDIFSRDVSLIPWFDNNNPMVYYLYNKKKIFKLQYLKKYIDNIIINRNNPDIQWDAIFEDNIINLYYNKYNFLNLKMFLTFNLKYYKNTYITYLENEVSKLYNTLNNNLVNGINSKNSILAIQDKNNTISIKPQKHSNIFNKSVNDPMQDTRHFSSFQTRHATQSVPLIERSDSTYIHKGSPGDPIQKERKQFDTPHDDKLYIERMNVHISDQNDGITNFRVFIEKLCECISNNINIELELNKTAYEESYENSNESIKNEVNAYLDAICKDGDKIKLIELYNYIIEYMIDTTNLRNQYDSILYEHFVKHATVVPDTEKDFKELIDNP